MGEKWEGCCRRLGELLGRYAGWSPVKERGKEGKEEMPQDFNSGGAWVTQSLMHLTVDFNSYHDLRVVLSGGSA